MNAGQLLARIDSTVKVSAGIAALGAGWILLATALLMTTEVVLRKTFSVSMQGIDEIGGYVLAITASLGFTYALYTKAHIQVDLLVRMLPPWGRRISQIVALLVLNFVVWSLVNGILDVVRQSYAFSAVAATPLRTPLVFPQSLWLLAFVLFGLAAFLRLLLLLRTLGQSGRHTPDDEIEDAVDVERPSQGELQAVRGSDGALRENVPRTSVP